MKLIEPKKFSSILPVFMTVSLKIQWINENYSTHFSHIILFCFYNILSTDGTHIESMGLANSRGNWLGRGGCERNLPHLIYNLQVWSEDRNHCSCTWLVLGKCWLVMGWEFSLDASYTLAVCFLLSYWGCSYSARHLVTYFITLCLNASVLVLRMFLW